MKDHDAQRKSKGRAPRKETMKYKMLIGASLLTAGLCACSPEGMSTNEIVEKLNECERAKLHADVYRLFGESVVIRIQCVPKKDKGA